ncbi:MAG: trypsin-like serine protease [Planctomycetota bacterium]
MTARTSRWLLGVLLGIGMATAIAWWLVASSADGYLLRAEDVGPARVHLGLRERLRQLAADGGTAPSTGDATDPERLAEEAERALLLGQIRNSRFAPLSDEQLRDGLAAADRGQLQAPDEDEAVRGIYGPDDRLDREAVEERQSRSTHHEERTRLGLALERSRSVGAWMHRGTLRGEAAPWQIHASTLGRFWNLCSGERFADQPIAALGTAFLVGPDTVATAAHVVDRGALNRLVLVFDYEVHDGSGPTEVREVYEPIRLLGIDASHATYDWAIVRLDRPVTGGMP